jgi:hypothetical protein
MLKSDRIAEQLKTRVIDRNRARTALNETLAMPKATEAMRDAAYEALATVTLDIERMFAEFDAALDEEVAAMAGFDVPGHITQNDVSTPAVGETFEQRVVRLAQKAVIEGCRIIHENAISAYVTSSRDAAKAYWVGVDRQNSRYSCECAGFQKGRPCKHASLVLVTRGHVTTASAVAA